MNISIIIPTFNRAEVISRTLDSILAQSYQDWKCYVVDDHSIDDTKSVVERYVCTDHRFAYLINERKKGAQGARNTGLYHCDSEWVYFFDSDNRLHQDCLKELSSAMTESVDVVQCFSRLVSVETGVTGRLFQWRNYGQVHENILYGESYADFNHTIIRRSKLLEIGGLDEDCPCMQEWDTHIRLSTVANYITVETVLVDYYVGAKDAISSNGQRDVVGKMFITTKYIKEWKRNPRRLKRQTFYLVTLIQKQEDIEFRKQMYEQLAAVVPSWYITYGKIMNVLLQLKLKIIKQ